MFKAINGDEGGLWAPSSLIEIGGSGMQGRLRPVVVNGIDFAHTYLATGQNQAIRVGSNVTTNRFYTLSAVGAVDGDVITVFTVPGFLFKVTVQFPGGTDIYSASQIDSTADGEWASFIFKGAAWEVYTAAPSKKIQDRSFTWLVGGTIIFGAGTSNVFCEGIGGGGGGGSGAYPISGSTNIEAIGGAGGGGAQLCGAYVDVSAGGTFYTSVGGGGIGGAVGINPGTDGSPTTFTDGVLTLARFNGAGGGSGGSVNNATTPAFAGSVGGLCVGGTALDNNYQRRMSAPTRTGMMGVVQPGQGGHSTIIAFGGGPPIHGTCVPGAGGASGAIAGAYIGGTGGGGGGAGYDTFGSVAGAGGAGGAAILVGIAGNGTAGGNGGSGFITVFYRGPEAVITGT